MFVWCASSGVWDVKPKFHLFAELSTFMLHESGDPRDFWTYQDEDFVGFLSTLAFSRGGAREPATAPLKVIDRYRGLGGK